MFSLRGVNFKNIIRYPDIEIREGDVTFVCGESGCGKSTLLKLLNGTVSADSGEILYGGKRIEEYDPVEIRRDVLLCGQSAYLMDGSIKANFVEYYSYRDLPCPDEREMLSYLKICAAGFSPGSAPDSSLGSPTSSAPGSLPGYAPDSSLGSASGSAPDSSLGSLTDSSPGSPLDSPCNTMSGGERQRVFAAICLSFKPKVFMLDEPTSALDDATAKTLMTNLTGFCREKGITLIVVSHNAALSGDFADQMITLTKSSGVSGEDSKSDVVDDNRNSNANGSEVSGSGSHSNGEGATQKNHASGGREI